MTLPLLFAMLSVAAPGAPPPDKGQVTLASRDWSLVLDGARAWSLHHVDYRGQQVTHERGAQSVSLDAGGGWIGGTNHAGGVEQCLDLTFEVDGETAPVEPGRTYQGATVTARRVARLDHLEATETIVVTDDEVTWRVSLAATEDQPVAQIYSFLLNWEPRFDRWAALKASGQAVDGAFTNGGGRFVSAATAWCGLYDSAAQQGFVTWHTTPPDYQVGGGGTSLWDQPAYHKQILSLMGKGRLAPGQTLTSEVHLAGFAAAPDAWIAAAAERAGVTADAAVAGALPGLVTATCGDWTVTFDESRAWTIQKTAWRGQSASHANGFHGAVLATGTPATEGTTSSWIGTGHTEGGQEQVERIRFVADGQPWTLGQGPNVIAREFQLIKDSRVGALRHRAVITVTGERLLEQHEFEATADQPVQTFYVFMHCWEPSFDRYVAQPAAGPVLRGAFDNQTGHKIDQDVRWSAIYDSGREFGVVTSYPELYTAREGGLGTFYWDRPNYHKQYLNLWGKGTIPAGTRLSCTLAVEAFAAAPGDWEAAAADRAARAFTGG